MIPISFLFFNIFERRDSYKKNAYIKKLGNLRNEYPDVHGYSKINVRTSVYNISGNANSNKVIKVVTDALDQVVSSCCLAFEF